MRKENTKKHKINLMDVLVILLALACIGTIAARAVITNSNKENYELKEYLLYFQIDDIKSSSYDSFDGHFGETVRIKDSDRILGTLGAEFTRGIAIHTYTENIDGNIVETKYYHPEAQGNGLGSEERCSISGYIVVTGKIINNQFLLDDEIPISSDDIIEIITEHIQTSIRVTDIVIK